MTVSFVERATPTQMRGERAFRSAVTSTVKAARPAIKESCRVAIVLAGSSAVMIALAALDAWIWLPRLGH
jgi:hypothetical protein